MKYYMLVLVAVAYLVYVHADACVQCNSSTDPKCATEPENYLAKSCSVNTSVCYTRVSNGNTIRGCASELDNATATACHNELECLICTFAEGCNRRIFPLSRAQCLQCSGNSTGDCATNTYIRPTVCPTYKLGDKCYIRNDGKNTTESFQRGCLTSAQAKKLCVNETNCFTCEGPGCNFISATSEQIPLARDSAAFLSSSIALLCIALAMMRWV
ncbi:PREDICTED: uncharacterized protein LOC108373437 [Rhagoletis zephyria]|uniref:uncharacterized protein LOC108373437 n=1 Tax=Rhagoletis zephyria TaxID=28612 RepID=UPI00081155D1|nr:PREDICTED: uncharacterized protein LOC108373437 [Rhagoletis zephyria]